MRRRSDFCPDHAIEELVAIAAYEDLLAKAKAARSEAKRARLAAPPIARAEASP